MSRKAIVLIPIMLILLGAICVLGYTLYGEYMLELEEKGFYENLSASHARGVSDLTQECVTEGFTAEGGIDIDWDALMERNNDTVGWITIPGTNVNYPVVQTTNNDYYLYRDFDRNPSRVGTIYADYKTSFDTSQILILYGHHISRRDDQFSQLRHYGNEDFMPGNNRVLTITPDRMETWTIFAFVRIDTHNSAAVDSLYRTGFSTWGTEGMSEYLSGITSRARVTDPSVIQGIEFGQRILLLSTCTSDGRKQDRFIVFAVSDSVSYRTGEFAD